MPTAEFCRRHGLSPSTFYKLKARYGGMEVSDAQKLRALEDENAKLKRLLADTMLDNSVVKDLLGMEAASPPSVRAPLATARGTEFASRAILRWAGDNGIDRHYIELRCPAGDL